jgi:DNA-binding transcriptional regulator GbsR (MarR family)
MIGNYISINDAVTTYKISQSKLRKIVKSLNGTKHVKKTQITGRHGFKYLISVAYLDSLLSDVKTSEINSKNENLDNVLIIQLTSENKQLINQVDKQFETIKGLTNTIQEQNKIVIAQSLQIHRLGEPLPVSNSKLNIENLIISVLVICIVIVIIYLLRS